MTDTPGPYARVIADSVYDGGPRLTTMEVRFHRFVLAEFNTHRVFSRNSASSRAIPVAKQLERVRREPALPLSWPAEQRGMQGGDELSDEKVEQATFWWRAQANQAADWAQGLSDLGLHKSVANRLLEPFMWHTVIVTSTAWDNFFLQRCSTLAQPEIQAAARLMLDAHAESEPVELGPSSWHTPYFDGDGEVVVDDLERAARVSAARCARVSYLTHDGKRDQAADLELYNRLVSAKPAHWSPLEHVATPWPENRQLGDDLSFDDDVFSGVPVFVRTGHLPRVGNLLGWRSLRTTVEAEKSLETFS